MTLIENFKAPPRGKLELLAENLRDLGQKVVRGFYLCYLRGQNRAEFAQQCAMFVSLLMGAAFLKVIMRADDEPVRQQAYCSLWTDMRQYEADSMMYTGAEPATLGFYTRTSVR